MQRRVVPPISRLAQARSLLGPSKSPSSFSSSAINSTLNSASSSASSSSSAPPDLSKVLIANRGEIACRVIRTCRRLGIPTVAVYSSADGPHSLHAQMADEAYLIGTGPTALESYLRADELLEIAVRSETAAIHPGYGFLSEHAAFSQAVQTAGIRFVGPPAAAMRSMGSKSQSKAIMEAAGVPTTPGYYSNHLEDQNVENLYDQAVHHVGFPLLIKAVLGGGGKGMRRVDKASDFTEALQSCQRESLASFGDDRVLLERYLVKPRHVEVQIFADARGNVVHLHERDCSLQRRHQKIVEEAPAADLGPAVRAKLGEMGKRAALAVGYVNAGTVEFLLDTTAATAATSNNDEPPPPDFYFCEMNTRLQVEHPITELITGIDLVEWQLRIAAGEELPILKQEEIPCFGHAFEARIYAENPARNFLPATGKVWHHRPIPTATATAAAAGATTGATTGVSGVRVDTGIQAGQEVSVYYDPMISKLIVHGADRTQALNKLIAALKNYQIAGVPTNIDFLIKCAQHPTFAIAGAVNTGFLDDFGDTVHRELGAEATTVAPLARVAGALAVLLRLENRILGAEAAAGGANTDKLPLAAAAAAAPWSTHWGSWRMGGTLGRPQRKLHMDLDGTTVVTCTSNRDGSFDLNWTSEDDNNEVISFHVDGSMTVDGTMEMVVNGSKRIKMTTVIKDDDGVLQVRMWPEGRKDDYFWQIDAIDPMSPLSLADAAAPGSVAGEGFVKAPMPGKISRVNFSVGDSIQAGDVVVVMEAMKMEHACSSPCSGILSEIRYKPNDVVDDGAILFVVDDPNQAGEDAA